MIVNYDCEFGRVKVLIWSCWFCIFVFFWIIFSCLILVGYLFYLSGVWFVYVWIGYWGCKFYLLIWCKKGNLLYDD